MAFIASCQGIALADEVLPRGPDLAPVLSEPRPEEGGGETVVVGRRPVSPDRTQDQVVVQGERLRESPRPNLLEALSQESASIHVTRRGIGPEGVASGAAGSVTVRGLSGSPNTQVVVVEDGVPDVQGIFGHPIPDAYVPDLLEEAVVVEGGDSVLYGTNAMGGAILLRSRWLDQEGVELTSDFAAGSFSTVAGTATALTRTGRWDSALGIHAVHSDGHRDGAGGGVLVLQGASRYRFNGGLSLTLRDKALHVTGGDPGTKDNPYLDHTFDVWRNNASAAFEYAGPRLRLTVLPYVTLGRHELYDGFWSLDWTIACDATLAMRPHPALEVLVGLHGQDVDGTIKDRIAGTKTDLDALADFAAFDQVTWRPLSLLTLVAGSRQLYSLKYGFVFLGKGGVRLDIYRGLFVRARVTRNFRQPTMRELYLPYPVANPSLEPETSLNLDGTIGYESGRVEVSVTVFNTRASNLIKYFGAWPAAEVVNIDRIIVFGVEGRLSWHDIGPFSGSVTGGWQDVGRYTRQNPNAKLDFVLTLNKTLGSHRLAAELCGEWVHGLYMNNYSRNPMDDVFFMDLALRYQYTTRAWSAGPYIYLRNILNRTYEYIAGYPMPGFHVLAGIRLGVTP